MILEVKGETKGSVSSVAIIYKASLYNKKLKRKKNRILKKTSIILTHQ